MEEDKDLEILQRICQCRRFSGVYTDIECIFEAIENLIARYKEQEEIINHQSKSLLKYQNAIPKSKVQEKIEELKDAIQYSANPLAIDNCKYAIEILQEVLED